MARKPLLVTLVLLTGACTADPAGPPPSTYGYMTAPTLLNEVVPPQNVITMVRENGFALPGQGRARKRNRRSCGALLRERLVRDAMNRFDVRPAHMLLAQPVGVSVPTRLA